MEDLPVEHQASHVLIVDDEAATCRMITSYLQEHDLQASAVSNGRELTRYLATEEPSLIILDLGPGYEDGLDLLRFIRFSSDIPVIITTGHLLEEVDRVIGLELGADDYLTKPFGLRELLARVRAVLRRHARRRIATTREPRRGGFRFGGWQLDRQTRLLTGPESAPVVLTKCEYDLLVAFLEAPQRPLTRAELMHEDVSDRSIDVQVLRLRRKLETNTSAPRVIRTERGVGYAFALPVETY